MSSYPTTRATAVAAGYDRILVDGVDVTYFRDKRTPTPGYLLTEPFAYGSATLDLPQVHVYEALGTGDLSWVRKGAPVTIQRVDDPNAATPVVLAVDYRGHVICVNVEGRSVSLEIGGQFAGRASMINRQPPLFRRVRDVGFWGITALALAGLSSTNRFGPTTGIEVVESGGSSLLAWAQEMCALSQGDDGSQWTLMPTTWGGDVWEMRLKDYASVDLTLFNDDTRTVVSLRDDLAEQPNTWYGTGVTPDGMRIRNGRYPGLVQGPAPEFPGSMTAGDTDADTTTGDGVTVLSHKLVAMGYLTITASFDYGAYTAATAAAVREVQRDAGLSATGNVNSNTWDALFDLSATGYSFSDAKIFPLVEDDAVRRFDYTANGSVAGLNPTFDSTALRVDRNVDFGGGVEKATMIGWCRGQSARLAGKNWAGTITLNGASAWTGQRGTDDAGTLTDADLMPMRDIRPGMNAWLPMFDGGTLVHISGVSYQPGAVPTVTLTVDTLARDLLELSEVIARNRESQRDIRREWLTTNRSRKPSGDMVTWDEWGGKLSQDVPLQGNRWNMVAMPAGQTGHVGRVEMSLRNDRAKFCYAIFGRKMTEKRMQRAVANPFPIVDDESWDQRLPEPWFNRGFLLFAKGDEEQPCGYFPKQHTNRRGNTTSHPITGDEQDASGFSYRTAWDDPAVVYLLIYPDRDCVLKRGQILYKQEDDAV